MSKNGLSGWKLDEGQKGHRILFKDYQKAIVDVLIGDPKLFWGSGDMWEAVKRRHIKISRASVIFYLNFLVADGLAEWDDATGKGGHHKLYRISKTWDEVRKHIAIKVIKGLAEVLYLDLSKTNLDWVLESWLSTGPRLV